jgi:hypothetical protein
MTLKCAPTRMLYKFQYSADDGEMRLARILPGIENTINFKWPIFRLTKSTLYHKTQWRHTIAIRPNS